MAVKKIKKDWGLGSNILGKVDFTCLVGRLFELFTLEDCFKVSALLGTNGKGRSVNMVLSCGFPSSSLGSNNFYGPVAEALFLVWGYQKLIRWQCVGIGLLFVHESVNHIMCTKHPLYSYLISTIEEPCFPH